MIKVFSERSPLYVFVFLFLVFISLTKIKAQDKIVDSLLSKLKVASNDTNKVKLLNNLATENFAIDPSKAKIYAEQALNLSKKLNYIKGTATSYHLIAVSFSLQNYSALALNAEIEAIRAAEKIKNFELIARAYNSIGNNYARLSDIENASKAFKKALNAIGKANDKSFSAAIIHNFGLLYIQQKQYDKGLSYLFKSTELSRKKGNDQWLVENYYEIGVAYEELKEHGKAIEFAEKSIDISQKRGYTPAEVNAYRLLGVIYGNQKNYKLSNQYFHKGLKKAFKSQLQQEQIQLFQAYSEMLEQQHKYAEALHYARSHDSLNKLLHNEVAEKAVIQNLEQIEKRQKNLENNLVKKDELLKWAEIKRNNQLLYATIVALIIVIAFSIILILKNRSIKEKNRLQGLQYIQIQQQKNKVEELNNIKDKLFSVIAHDLRSPFTSFRNMIDLYDEDILSKEDIGFLLKQISKEASNINALLDNLLIWAKSQMEGFRLNSRPISIKKVFNEVIYHQRNAINNKNLAIKDTITAEDFANADYEMTKVIVRNLMSNAIKFTPEGGTISLSCQKKNNLLEIAVSDTGIGLSENQKQYLFNGDFYTTKGLNNEKGTGIGLQISKDFIEKHQGTIWVESEVQKGSIFYFTLPAGVATGIVPERDISLERDQTPLLNNRSRNTLEEDLESQSAQDQYALLAKVTNGTVYDLDIKNGTIIWNEGLFLNFGYTDQTTDLNWRSSRIHPHDVKNAEESLYAALQDKSSTWRYEYRFRNSENKYKYVQDRALILFDDEGSPLRMIGVIENIQERKDASAEMFRLSLVARNVTNLVVITDYEDKVVWVNNAFEKHTGYKLNEIIGIRPRDFLGGPDTNKEVLDSLDNYVQKHEPVSVEILNYTKAGDPYWTHINCTPYYDPLFNNIGYVSIQTVVTDRKQKEQLILDKNEALREIARISSHEVRSPLSSIMGLVTLLQEPSNQVEFEEYLKLLHLSSKQLDAIIHKIHHHITSFDEMVDD